MNLARFGPSSRFLKMFMLSREDVRNPFTTVQFLCSIWFTTVATMVNSLKNLGPHLRCALKYSKRINTYLSPNSYFVENRRGGGDLGRGARTAEHILDWGG